eukprot:363378-Chlamydomonas_euryale.AAC.45
MGRNKRCLEESSCNPGGSGRAVVWVSSEAPAATSNRTHQTQHREWRKKIQASYQASEHNLLLRQ